jgi:thermostable 8-oxoguanine DNA glycosylase
MNKKQLEFTTILNDAFTQYERRIASYMFDNKEAYEGFARVITPGSYTDDEIFYRVAFAILSANAPFEDSVKAFNVCIKKRAAGVVVKPHDIIWFKQIPAKAKYINALNKLDLQILRRYTEQDFANWHNYRLRLRDTVKGLGLAKASFAAALLYPLEADVACVDTWIQKVFLGHTGFKSLGVADYLLVESKIRTFANCFGISTFLAQWLIWDHARGGMANTHAIFPGGHK